MKLLHIDSSILGEDSASRALTREIVDRFRTARPDTEVTYLDLAAEGLPHFSQRSLTKADELDAARDEQALDAVPRGRRRRARCAHVQLHDPVPAQGVDRSHRVRARTFRYGPKGPEGLAGDKQVIVAISRGGIYPAGAPAEFG